MKKRRRKRQRQLMAIAYISITAAMCIVSAVGVYCIGCMMIMMGAG